MVPLDIRRAIADVRSCLGMSTVLWPAILYRDDNVGPDVIIPDNSDQFGTVKVLVYPCLCSQPLVLHCMCVAATAQLRGCNPYVSSSYRRRLLIAQLRDCTFSFDRVHAKSLLC